WNKVQEGKSAGYVSVRCHGQIGFVARALHPFGNDRHLDGSAQIQRSDSVMKTVIIASSRCNEF
ncbi:hypothetical protein L0N00_16635, partial [Eggerthella lenta]|nr:hypothetical protein [Eggerthella lenta]